ncbi:MAG: hypothetical protein JW841_04970 [Deltaproteobacteria bacterium]|nr:hypothetical protein [Deltaproteobacteria bacterium]
MTKKNDSPTPLANQASEQTLQEALGLGAIVSGSDDTSPLLPLDIQEPGMPISMPRVSVNDSELINNIQRLTAGNADKAREALTNALNGEAYISADLPDARAMLLGIARAIVAYGVNSEELVNVIIDAINE